MKFAPWKRPTYRLSEEVHGTDLPVDASVPEGVNDLDQTGLLGPGQHRELADDAFDVGHEDDVNSRVKFGGGHIHGHVSEPFQFHADERRLLGGWNGPVHQLELLGLQQRTGVQRRTRLAVGVRVRRVVTLPGGRRTGLALVRPGERLLDRIHRERTHGRTHNSVAVKKKKKKIKFVAKFRLFFLKFYSFNFKSKFVESSTFHVQGK